MNSNASCLSCQKRPAISRGNCMVCYRRNRTHVRAGKTTWELLVAAGLVLESRYPDGPRTTRRIEVGVRQENTAVGLFAVELCRPGNRLTVQRFAREETAHDAAQALAEFLGVPMAEEVT